MVGSRDRLRHRKIFCDFELQARLNILPAGHTAADRKRHKQEKRGIYRDTLATWRALTDEQVINFVNCFQAAEDARRDFNERRRQSNVNNEAARLNALWAAPPDRVPRIRWPRETEACRQLVEGFQLLIRRQNAVIVAFRHLQRSASEVYDHPLSRWYGRWKRQQQGEILQDLKAQVRIFRWYSDNPPLPPRHDGAQKVPLDWITAARHRSNTGQLERAMLESEDSEHESWIGGWRLGGGARSMSGIWVEVDENNWITRRIVKKVVHRQFADWADMTMWYAPDENVLDGNARMPMEVGCLKLLGGARVDEASETVSVPELIQWNKTDEELSYRIYMTYCTHQDLKRLTEIYNTEPQENIPEPFLWRVFHSLTIAGIAMETGGSTRRGDLEGRLWKEIVHRDLKPANIFLDDPGTIDWASYPTPVVGDFDLAVRTHKDDVLNPSMFLAIGGTPLYQAPEQRAFVNMDDLKPIDRFKLLSHTNVYGVGATMWALAMRREPPSTIVWLGDGEGQLRCTAKYSKKLLGLIDECLNFDPQNRPNWLAILKIIEEAIEDEDLTGGRYSGDDVEFWHQLKDTRSLYARALTLEQMPRRT